MATKKAASTTRVPTSKPSIVRPGVSVFSNRCQLTLDGGRPRSGLLSGVSMKPRHYHSNCVPRQFTSRCTVHLRPCVGWLLTASRKILSCRALFGPRESKSAEQIGASLSCLSTDWFESALREKRRAAAVDAGTRKCNADGHKKSSTVQRDPATEAATSAADQTIQGGVAHPL